MYRQQIFQNLRDGMRACLTLMEQEGRELANPDLLVRPRALFIPARDLPGLHPSLLPLGQELWDLGERFTEVRSGEPFPPPLKNWLRALWTDQGMRAVIAAGDEATIPERYF